jgi:hypothetical protein
MRLYTNMALLMVTALLNACATTQFDKTVGKWNNSFFENSWIFHRDGTLTFEKSDGKTGSNSKSSSIALIENQKEGSEEYIKWKIVENANPFKLILEIKYPYEPQPLEVNYIQDFPASGKMRICSKNGFNMDFPESFGQCFNILEFTR